MSLKTLHVIFILICVVAADMFGAWAVWDYGTSRNPNTLALGIAAFVVGFGLIGYGIWFVRKADRAHI